MSSCANTTLCSAALLTTFSVLICSRMPVSDSMSSPTGWVLFLQDVRRKLKQDEQFLCPQWAAVSRSLSLWLWQSDSVHWFFYSVIAFMFRTISLFSFMIKKPKADISVWCGRHVSLQISPEHSVLSWRRWGSLVWRQVWKWSWSLQWQRMLV